MRLAPFLTLYLLQLCTGKQLKYENKMMNSYSVNSDSSLPVDSNMMINSGSMQMQSADPPQTDQEISNEIRNSVNENVGEGEDDNIVNPNDLVTVFDYEQCAEQTLPKPIKDYVNNGADFNFTLEENRRAFGRLRIRPRHFHGVKYVNLEQTILGIKVPFPVAISPSAFHRLYAKEGEIYTATAAAEAGTLMIVSGFSTTSMDDLRKAAPNGNFWLQMYPYTNRTLNRRMIEEAKRLNFAGILLTVDAPVAGRKINVAKNRFEIPSNIRFPILEHAFSKSYEGFSEEIFETLAKYRDADFTWENIKDLKEMSNLPVIAKGILTGSDAEQAIQNGIDAIIVSNHGGRQLDGDPATIEALPDVVEAVNGRVEVFMDSGIRNGIDAFKALALGARAVFLGRSIVWGLACKGQDGALSVLRMLRNELERTMRLAGARDLADISSSQVVKQKYFDESWNPVII